MTELGLNLPLYALAGVQLLVALLLLAPKPVSRLAASLYKSTEKNLVVKTVLYTTAAGLSAIAAASLYQAYDIAGDIRTTSGQRALVLEVDTHRAQVSIVLAVANILMMFLNKALALEQLHHDSALLNLNTMKKQAAGLQAEYHRATTESKGAAAGAEGGASRSDLQAKVDALSKDRTSLRQQVEDAEQARRKAEVNLEAMKSQAKSLNQEYDRLLAEKDHLVRQLGQAGGSKKAD